VNTKSERPTFIVKLKPKPRVANPYYELKRALKILGRACGFQCVTIATEQGDQTDNDGGQQ
jgi:hypothetical protein